MLGGFYTYLALGSLQTSCREEETFPLPQDNLPSYRKRTDVSGWSIWMWKRSPRMLLLHPKGWLHRWPKSTGWLHMLSGTWGRTRMRMLLGDVVQVPERAQGIWFLPCSSCECNGDPRWRARIGAGGRMKAAECHAFKKSPKPGKRGRKK